MKKTSSYRKLFVKILKNLIEKGLILSFSELPTAMPENGYKFRYGIVLDKNEDSAAELIFVLWPLILTRELEVRSNSRICTVITSANIHLRKVEDILQNRILGWKKGRNTERVFEEQFLIPLQKKHPKTIVGIRKASTEADVTHGFDFIVLFSEEGSSKINEVKFNLKSSHNFLHTHKRRYPDISTFLFSEEKSISKKQFILLTNRFFDFLTVAKYEAVHI